MLIGIIEKYHIGKKAHCLRKCRVLYEPVGAEACSRCDIGVNIIMNMILPHTYNPEPGSFFALKLPAVENEAEIIPEIVPGGSMEETAETESETNVEVEENISLQRRAARRSTASVSDENSVSTYESTDGELSDGSSDESDDMSFKFDAELDANIKTD